MSHDNNRASVLINPTRFNGRDCTPCIKKILAKCSNSLYFVGHHIPPPKIERYSQQQSAGKWISLNSSLYPPYTILTNIFEFSHHTLKPAKKSHLVLYTHLFPNHRINPIMTSPHQLVFSIESSRALLQ